VLPGKQALPRCSTGPLYEDYETDDPGRPGNELPWLESGPCLPQLLNACMFMFSSVIAITPFLLLQVQVPCVRRGSASRSQPAELNSCLNLP